MKIIPALPTIWINSIAVIAVLVVTGASVLVAAQMPMAWMDDASGFAISGYDPVDYFVKGRAVRPNNRTEAQWGGVSWNFSNTGNKGAFLDHPHIYAPRFGGVDPYLLSQNRWVQGNPTLFEIYENRLYLFYNGVSMQQWKEGRKAHIARASKVWPKAAVSLGLNSAKWVGSRTNENKDGYLYGPRK